MSICVAMGQSSASANCLQVSLSIWCVSGSSVKVGTPSEDMGLASSRATLRVQLLHRLERTGRVSGLMVWAWLSAMVVSTSDVNQI